jgi:formyl-CoA transferase
MVAAEVPAGPIYSAADMAADPHFRARDMLLGMPVAVDGKPEEVLFPGIVPKLGQQPGRVRWLGPELGEHTADVLADVLELSSAEIAALRDRKVV